MLVISDSSEGLHHVRKLKRVKFLDANYIICGKSGLFNPTNDSVFANGEITNQIFTPPCTNKAFASISGTRIYANDPESAGSVVEKLYKSTPYPEVEQVYLVATGDEISCFNVLHTFKSLNMEFEKRNIHKHTLRRSASTPSRYSLEKQAMKVHSAVYVRHFFTARIVPILKQMLGAEYSKSFEYITPLSIYILFEILERGHIPRSTLGKETLRKFGAFDFEESGIRSADVIFAASFLVRSEFAIEDRASYILTEKGQYFSTLFDKQMIDRVIYQLVHPSNDFIKIDQVLFAIERQLTNDLLG